MCVDEVNMSVLHYSFTLVCACFLQKPIYIFDPNVYLIHAILKQCELCEKTLCTSL